MFFTGLSNYFCLLSKALILLTPILTKNKAYRLIQCSINPVKPTN